MSRFEIHLALLLWVGAEFVLDLPSWLYLHGWDLLESLGCLSPVSAPVDQNRYFLDAHEGAFEGDPITAYQPLAEPEWLRYLNQGRILNWPGG